MQSDFYFSWSRSLVRKVKWNTKTYIIYWWRVIITWNFSDSLSSFKCKYSNPGVHKVAQPHRYTEAKNFTLPTESNFSRSCYALCKQNCIQKFDLLNWSGKLVLLESGLSLELDPFSITPTPGGTLQCQSPTSKSPLLHEISFES